MFYISASYYGRRFFSQAAPKYIREYIRDNSVSMWNGASNWHTVISIFIVFANDIFKIPLLPIVILAHNHCFAEDYFCYSLLCSMLICGKIQYYYLWLFCRLKPWLLTKHLKKKVWKTFHNDSKSKDSIMCFPHKQSLSGAEWVQYRPFWWQHFITF